MRAMLAETRKVLKLSEGNPVAYYLQAMLAARAHKFELARSLYKRTGGAMADQPAAMLLASAIDYQTAHAEQAVTTLQPLVTPQPNNPQAPTMPAAPTRKLGN